MIEEDISVAAQSVIDAGIIEWRDDGGYSSCYDRVELEGIIDAIKDTYIDMPARRDGDAIGRMYGLSGDSVDWLAGRMLGRSKAQYTPTEVQNLCLTLNRILIHKWFASIVSGRSVSNAERLTRLAWTAEHNWKLEVGGCEIIETADETHCVVTLYVPKFKWVDISG